MCVGGAADWIGRGESWNSRKSADIALIFLACHAEGLKVVACETASRKGRVCGEKDLSFRHVRVETTPPLYKACANCFMQLYYLFLQNVDVSHACYHDHMQ